MISGLRPPHIFYSIDVFQNGLQNESLLARDSLKILPNAIAAKPQARTTMLVLLDKFYV